MKIQKGYWVKITSWENDADNYQTKELMGLSEEKVKCLVGFCKLHCSKNAWGTEKGFGNMYDPGDHDVEKYLDAVRELIATDPENYRSLFWIKSIEDEEECLDDIICEFSYDIGLHSGEFYTRVFSNIEILYVPDDIEIEDVTKKFLK
ncbi:MAG TPA: hypothetical protein VFM18_10690 [Methanosarcina sp.]|nr:hypothetical protein [Methanosarcina sp.]